MANIDAADLPTDIVHAGEYGNQAVKYKKLTPSAAPKQGDVLRFFRLPANTLITDFRYVNGAFGAGVTLSFGYRPVDGSAGQDAAFVAAADASAAGSGRTQAPPVLLEKESYIVGVVGGADTANAAAVDVVVDYEFKGSK